MVFNPAAEAAGYDDAVCLRRRPDRARVGIGTMALSLAKLTGSLIPMGLPQRCGP
jgi:hypothetical protein